MKVLPFVNHTSSPSLPVESAPPRTEASQGENKPEGVAKEEEKKETQADVAPAAASVSLNDSSSTGDAPKVESPQVESPASVSVAADAPKVAEAAPAPKVAGRGKHFLASFYTFHFNLRV